MNPKRKEILLALEILLDWSTGQDKGNNPYSYPAVQYALIILGRSRGDNPKYGHDVEVRRNLPIPYNKKEER